MKKLIILLLFSTMLLTACQSKNVSVKNNDESILDSESSTVNEKGSITNPYDGLNESFQITCQAPYCGEDSEIVLEFSNMCLSKGYFGWRITGNVTLVSGNKTAPVHINDYVTFKYYNEDGLIGYSYSTILEDDLKEDKEFVFRKDNLTNASMHTFIKLKNSKGQVPKVACIDYFDGTNYKEVFFYRYEDGKPLGIND
ncbi:hypothetical protein [Anaerosporobacter sp.]|uniref:hypothetical protein n=1 Tax=Anaerosporobacter sp. TaxID=1872529 RepID=UPI00286EF67F|nr:hypothetical protein [Anaerosporobacter sp.]